ncbi:hypothetical protein OLMES_2561 [Oleiphilus messinensis]|uniref:Cell division coordinator CpoB n=1 Tax=Oleiphilus messinensis TaxID=141451 RepID=A0A1Y0IB19_9GAMM|nr:tol-pal system protein YbgF [Oleiphilus messinensis]ARU56614.1 hypothetical protein OLMES_2561 [Oleiphilus messinensis]
MMPKRLFILLFCLSGIASAATPVVSTPALQVAQNDQAGSTVVAGSAANAEMYFMLETLQREVLTLRGLVEELQHQVSVLKKQSRERYVDLDQRLLELNKREAQAVTPAGTQDTAGAVTSGDDAANQSSATPEQKAAYQKAYELIKKKDFNKALDALHGFIADQPENELTVNAYYWLGEVYMVLPQLEQAKQAFTVVTSRYPEHRKAADALFKLGVVYDKLGDKQSAAQFLSSVAKQYPASSAAKLASDYLSKL